MKRPISFRPSWKERLQFIALGPRDVLLYLVCRSFYTFLKSFTLLPPWYLDWSSRIRARRAFYLAARRVPAYARFLDQQGATIDSIPETDKNSYIKAFSTEDRCVGGRLPDTQIMIDESSGSTGTPYNWVRSLQERQASHQFISYFASYCYGTRPWVTINAFSMGAWATGLNMGLALQKNSVVKNTGPDLAKIFHTLSFFGPQYPYLIMGYPPFLKQMIDVAEKENFPLHQYRLKALVGGEGMSEGLRDYLLKRFQTVYSGYGATDLEIGIAGETPLSVAIRRLARENPAIRRQLFGNDSRLPMLFQYNPLMHYVEVNDHKEVIFTITRQCLLSPRIRYNVHDEGGVLRYDEMAKILAAAGHNIRQLVSSADFPIIRLPFLWIFGRRDYTVSVMGANIYPEDLEQCLYAEPELARITRSFCQSLLEMPNGGVRPLFYFEVATEPTPELIKQFGDSILKHLIDLNADFRAAWHEYPETLVPEVRLCRPGEGPFAVSTGQIKQTRLLKKN